MSKIVSKNLVYCIMTDDYNYATYSLYATDESRQKKADNLFAPSAHCFMAN